MQQILTLRKAIMVGCLSGFLSTGLAQLSPAVFEGIGSTSSDGWNNLTIGNFSGFGNFPGRANWPSSIQANVPGSGDARLWRIAGAPRNDGGPYPAGEGLYFGNTTQFINDPGGILEIEDSTPVAGLRTVVLQFKIMEAMGHDFVLPSGLPQLFLNGGSSGVSAGYPRLLVARYQDGDFPSPETGQLEPLYVNTVVFQWDLPPSTTATSFRIRFSGVTHSRIFEMRLDQTSVLQTQQVFHEIPALRLLSIGAPTFDGTATTMTHTFSGSSGKLVDLEYSPSLGTPWTRKSAVSTGEGSFEVTFQQSGDHRADWGRRMFFRARPSSIP